ncbi:hypothetical protein TNIN_178791 [Trichonephila inaurata madagascariensis]|uniref:Uncharacterized protein n=1 Tax=Trichonephila inaurata madagascariensis TaxID=2747483 RepID=A0A8X6Y344_9ARAC|nr:hypothetical protein TNIN_178791 [Trichonephila inaurata madagascariensis]
MALSSTRIRKWNIKIYLPHREGTHRNQTGPTTWRGLKFKRLIPAFFTLIVQGYDNMIPSPQNSNSQDEHAPTFVERSNKEPTMRTSGKSDDTAILSRPRYLNTLTEKINEHLAHLEIWFSVWKIALNTSKTEAVFFSQRVPPPEI